MELSWVASVSPCPACRRLPATGNLTVSLLLESGLFLVYAR